MPKKYHIDVEQEAPRHTPVAKIAAFELEGCLGCLQCVKRTSCIYDVFGRKRFDPMALVETGDAMCMSCLRCVQECKKGILTRAPNPQYLSLGDDYWRPDIITNLQKQAETGKIPVSGAGYRGAFSGPGFDTMWTDMSEIVRPTRDGIHGREYISTVIDLGRKPDQLVFDQDGKLVTPRPPIRELPLPVIFDRPDKAKLGPSARRAMARAAMELGTLFSATQEEAAGILAEFRSGLIVWLAEPPADISVLDGVPMVQLPWSPEISGQIDAIKQARPDIITIVRLALDESAPARASELARANGEVVLLEASPHGRGLGRMDYMFLTELLRDVNNQMVADCCREQVSLLVSGGIALAEHLAKSILCGADGVALNQVLPVALECQLCKECHQGMTCPVGLEEIDEVWGQRRIVNLMGAFHSQLVELMGAMGLREARRLRGEVGRAMFFKDLEKMSFAPLFGKRAPGQAKSPTPPPPETQPVEGDVFEPLRGLVKTMPSRYRNALARFKVTRSTQCIACGKCAEVCEYGVHAKSGDKMLAPKSKHCRGKDYCQSQGAYCGDSCPVQAISVGRDPAWATLGDPRWPADLLAATWVQAETGLPPVNGLEYRKGASGGGFDRMDLVFPAEIPDASFNPSDVDLSVPLNRRMDEGRPDVTISVPMYGGGMSFGSVSVNTLGARAKAYSSMNSFTCTGEGGYPPVLEPYDDHVITQVATGLFGVMEETIQRVRIVEFKYAQGAKPGLGGHLLGDKVTPAVAAMRQAVVGNSLFSPFPFHSVYSVEDHKKHVDWIKQINPRALVSVKVSTPSDVDMVAVGSYYAGAHIVHLDGSYGGTGAAPDIAKKNIAMPLEYAVPMVHRFLVQEGVRDRVTLVASGGLRSAWDVAKVIALGANAVVTGTADMVALECIRCSNCESGRGCARGIATTDPELSAAYDLDWGAQRIINMFNSWALQLQRILWRLGMKSIKELVGRSDLLTHQEYTK